MKGTLHEADAYRRRQDDSTGRQFLQADHVSVGHGKDGTMDEEYPFWDNRDNQS